MRPSPLHDAQLASSSSDEQIQEEDEAAAAASLLAVQNPLSQVKESESQAPFRLKIKILKTVTVVRIHQSSHSDEADENQTHSASVVKKRKICESDFNQGKKKESTLTESATNCSKSKKSTDAKSAQGVKKNKSAVDPNSHGQRVLSDETRQELLSGIADVIAKNGKDSVSNMYKLYDLSKKISGCGGETMIVSSNGASDARAKSNGQRKRDRKKHILKVNAAKKESVHHDAESGNVSLPRLVEIVKGKFDFSHELAIRGLRLMDKNKRVEMVKQWEILLSDETELNLRRLELTHEQGQLALAALKAASQ